MAVVAVLLAGGVGARMGADRPKQLLELAGRPVLHHTIAALDACEEVDRIVVVMAEGSLDDAARVAAEGGSTKIASVVAGGSTRSESSFAGLADLDADDVVLIHDAVRPFVSQRVVTACVSALGSFEAVCVVAPTPDTIVRVDDDRIVEIPPRAALRRAQTPQGFHVATIVDAYQRASASGDMDISDDCGVILRYRPDVPIGIVEGDAWNVKITVPSDLALAEALLARPDLRR